MAPSDQKTEIVSPAEVPASFEFAINLKTAKALGFSIPLPLLDHANEVIE
jgi:ABC-type uncharacterized transport system substrate-binding protein